MRRNKDTYMYCKMSVHSRKLRKHCEIHVDNIAFKDRPLIFITAKISGFSSSRMYITRCDTISSGVYSSSFLHHIFASEGHTNTLLGIFEIFESISIEAIPLLLSFPLHEDVQSNCITMENQSTEVLLVLSRTSANSSITSTELSALSSIAHRLP